MKSEIKLYDRHLRVIHACEKGATGVYWGHRFVASLFYPDLVVELTSMHQHETEHYQLFSNLITRKKAHPVSLPVMWCAGGIIYGFITALLGRRAIWKSTAVIEGIVEKELLDASEFFRTRDEQIYIAIHKILLDELQHKARAEANSQNKTDIDGLISPIAKAGANLSKKLAEKL